MASPYPDPTLLGDEPTLPVQPNVLQPYTSLPPAPMLPTARPDLQSNPLMDVGRMLMGFAAGTQARMNPIMLYEEQARQEDARRQLAAAQLQMTKRARQVQEEQFLLNMRAEERRAKTDEERFAAERKKVATETGLKLIENPDGAIRAAGYRLLQEAGHLGKDVDVQKLSLLTKPDFTMARDEAIALLETGVDPASPAFGGRYSFLPLDAYKVMAQENPLGLNALRSKPMPEGQALQAVVARIKSLPMDRVLADPGLQRQLQAAQDALQINEKVNYGEKVNAILGSMGYKNPALAPREAIAIALKQSEEVGPPTLERLVAQEQAVEQKIANAQSPEELAALKDVKAKLLKHRETLVGTLAEIQGAKTKASEAERPLQESDKAAIAPHEAVIATAKEFKSFTKEEVEKYSGMVTNLAQRAKMTFNETLRAIGLGKIAAPTDERFVQFQALMGRFQENIFALAGKQATGLEMRVARMSTPTGSEPGGAAEILAKARYMEAFTRVAMDTRLALAKIGKGHLNADLLERMQEDAMQRAGLSLPTASNPRPWMPRVDVPTGYKSVN